MFSLVCFCNCCFLFYLNTIYLHQERLLSTEATIFFFRKPILDKLNLWVSMTTEGCSMFSLMFGRGGGGEGYSAATWNFPTRCHYIRHTYYIAKCFGTDLTHILLRMIRSAPVCLIWATRKQRHLSTGDGPDMLCAIWAKFTIHHMGHIQITTSLEHHMFARKKAHIGFGIFGPNLPFYKMATLGSSSILFRPQKVLLPEVAHIHLLSVLYCIYNLRFYYWLLR